MELTLCLWMEIKLVWMRDLGDGAGLWDSPSLSISAIAFLNRVLTSCVRREGKMPPVHAVRTWSERPAPHFHIKDTCEGCCTVLTCKKKGKKHSLCHFTVLPFFQCFLCFTIHRLSLAVSSPSRFFPHFWSLLICLPPSWTDALFLYHLNFLFWFWVFLLLSRSPSPLSSSTTHTVDSFWWSPWKQIAFTQGIGGTNSSSPLTAAAWPRGFDLWPQLNEVGLMPLNPPMPRPSSPPSPRGPSSSSFVQAWVFQHHGVRTAPLLLIRSLTWRVSAWTAPVVHPTAGWLSRGMGNHQKCMQLEFMLNLSQDPRNSNRIWHLICHCKH